MQITERFKAGEAQARAELNAGNFDGVPKSVLKASGVTEDQVKKAREAQQVAKIIEQRQMRNRQTTAGKPATGMTARRSSRPAAPIQDFLRI